MLFDSSLRRELWRSFVGTLVILLTVVMTMVLIRVLGQATKGSFAPSDVSLILSYAVVGQLPVLLALGLNEQQARNSVRVSIGRYTREADVERAIEVFARVIGAAAVALW